jgi:hypothetical protein
MRASSRILEPRQRLAVAVSTSTLRLPPSSLIVHILLSSHIAGNGAFTITISGFTICAVADAGSTPALINAGSEGNAVRLLYFNTTNRSSFFWCVGSR